MTKIEALQIIKLLSAMESWALSDKRPLPDYLHDALSNAISVLEDMVLRKDEEQK